MADVDDLMYSDPDSPGLAGDLAASDATRPYKGSHWSDTDLVDVQSITQGKRRPVVSFSGSTDTAITTASASNAFSRVEGPSTPTIILKRKF